MARHKRRPARGGTSGPKRNVSALTRLQVRQEAAARPRRMHYVLPAKEPK
jgi:hypothetical protein